MTDWMVERNQDLGSYSYAADMKKIDDDGALDLFCRWSTWSRPTPAWSGPPRTASRPASSTRRPASTCSCAW